MFTINVVAAKRTSDLLRVACAISTEFFAIIMTTVISKSNFDASGSNCSETTMLVLICLTFYILCLLLFYFFFLRLKKSKERGKKRHLEFGRISLQTACILFFLKSWHVRYTFLHFIIRKHTYLQICIDQMGTKTGEKMHCHGVAGESAG